MNFSWDHRDKPNTAFPPASKSDVIEKPNEGRVEKANLKATRHKVRQARK
jgi:hypothetical protein